MNGLDKVEALLKDRACSQETCGEVVLEGIPEIEGLFFKDHDVKKEKFLCGLLKGGNHNVAFSALCCFLRAQKQGIPLQTETLRQLDKIKHSKDPKKIILIRAAQRCLKTEQTT